jgi:hypothetical protein
MRQIFENESVNNIWDDLVYSHTRLLYDEHTKDLATPFEKLIAKTEDAWKEQRKVWRAETEAQANVDAINFRTDERTLDFAFALEGANRKHPQGEQRQKRYFPITAVKVAALALENQLPYTESFANSTPKEAEPELQAFAAGFSRDVTEAKAALSRKQKAADERRDNRVQVISALVEEINNTREATLAELLKRRAPQQKSKDWPESFFRKQKKNTPEEREREQKQQTILGVFTARGLEVSPELEKKINKEAKPETLLRWLTKAASAATAYDALSSDE